MAVTCELYHNDGDRGSTQATDVYVILGTSDKATAYASLAATAPAAKFSMTLDDLDVKVLGPSEWLGTASYKDDDTTHESEDNVYSFVLSGGSEQITHGLAVSAYPDGAGNTPDFGGAINVEVDGNKMNVKGTSREFPVFEWEETVYHPEADITAAYVAILKGLYKHTNDAQFTDAIGNTFAIGEVLFRGATGAPHGKSLWRVTYRFAARDNETGITIGDIVNVARLGWEYLWTLYEEIEDAAIHRLVKQPKAVYLHQLFKSGDFSDLKLYH